MDEQSSALRRMVHRLESPTWHIQEKNKDGYCVQKAEQTRKQPKQIEFAQFTPSLLLPA
jgi:hypothetical protein